MKPTPQQQILKRFPNSRFFDADPRTDEHMAAWKNTHDWFILRTWPDHGVTLWVDVGYGLYALQVGKTLHGFAKDMIQTKEWVFLGEFYGELTLAKVVES